MKKFTIIFLTVLLAASSAWATDVQFSGDFAARGKHTENYNLATNDAGVYNPDAWDQDLNIHMHFVQSETTKVITRFAVKDMTWGTATGANSDDDIQFERVYLSHMFPTNTILETGLKTGGGFAKAFGDTAGGKWRVQVTQPLSEALTIGGLTEMTKEKSGQAVKDAEKDDTYSYAVYGLVKAGPLGIQLLWQQAYLDAGVAAADDVDQTTLNAYVIGVDGSFGIVGFEGEYIYKDYDVPAGSTDYSVYGFYANVWGNLDIVKVGGQYAYASWDTTTNSGMTFGEDYTPAAILTDDVYWGNVGGSGGASALSCVNVYVSANIGDKMSVSADYSMLTSTIDDASDSGMQWYKASGSEFDLGFSYKITDALTYSIGYSAASVDYDDSFSTTDPEGLIAYWHKLALSF